MYRNFIKQLQKWENDNIKEPLMIIGARQIGKTYIINEFCENQYKDFIYLNFEKIPELSKVFDGNLVPEEIIKNISILVNKEISSETAIFFDEIQICERAITSLKYFCEASNNYRVICAGSLLGVKLHRFQSSFPVGKVRILEMYPMDFEEFLYAIGEDMLIEAIKEGYKNKKPLIEPVHEKALNYYNHYLIVGGMPQAVLNYINNEKDITKFDREIHRSIITAYIADMRKYTISGAEAVKINDVYESIPRQLAKENTKFKYSIVNRYANKRDYELPIDWLNSSGMIYKVNKLKTPMMPLKVYIDDSNFKIYISDVGLLSTMANIDIKNIAFSENNTYKGALTENYIAQILKVNKWELIYFKPTQSMEIDFIISDGNDVIPIEVKSSLHTKSTSLNGYIEKYKPKYCIRLSAKNFGMVDKIFSVPLYAAFCIR